MGNTVIASGSSVEYVLSNAGKTKLPAGSFDLVTVMFVLHEAPFLGRYRILREARRLLREGGTLAVGDISSEYRPSRTMLAGEPYVVEYQKNIDRQLRPFRGFPTSGLRTSFPVTLPCGC